MEISAIDLYTNKEIYNVLIAKSYIKLQDKKKNESFFSIDIWFLHLLLYFRFELLFYSQETRW